MPNWHEFVIAYFAMQKIGAIVVLLVSRHGQAEIDYLSSLTRPVAWIVPEQYRNINYVTLIENVCEGKQKPQAHYYGESRREGRVLRMEELIEEAALNDATLDALAKRRPDPMEVATVTPTGGTTGLPKAVPRIHNDFIANVEYHSKAWEIMSDDTVLDRGAGEPRSGHALRRLGAVFSTTQNSS